MPSQFNEAAWVARFGAVLEEIERVALAPVSLVVTRFRHPERSIIDRRKWGGR